MKKILVLNGPNLNQLGTREPAIYGDITLDAINRNLTDISSSYDIELEYFQSNSEALLIDKIENAIHSVDRIIINPGALAHTSIALRDALVGSQIPYIEVHLSNIYARESFRHHSFLSDKAQGIICGFGAKSYVLALHSILDTWALK